MFILCALKWFDIAEEHFKSEQSIQNLKNVKLNSSLELIQIVANLNKKLNDIYIFM